MKCPQCSSEMEKVKFDVGPGISVDSHHCRKCGFNVTDNEKLEEAMATMRKKMAKEVKVIRVGEGVGLRIPNDFVKSYNLRKGAGILLKPEADGIKIVV